MSRFVHNASAFSTMECSLYCQICCKRFEELHHFKQHVTSKEHQQMLQDVFQKGPINCTFRIPYIVFVAPKCKQFESQKYIVGLSLITLCFSQNPDTSFYLCHVCKEKYLMDKILCHTVSQSHCFHYFVYTNPDYLSFSWKSNMDMATILGWKLKRESRKSELQTLQLLHLPPLLIKKLKSSTYSEVMQTLCENDKLLERFKAMHQYRVTLQGYHSNPIRKHPLLGLQHIVECVSFEKEQKHYLCTLCRLVISSHKIIGHLLSFDHVHFYFEAWHPSTLISNKSDRNSVLLDCAKQAEKIHAAENVSVQQVKLQPDVFKLVNFGSYSEALKSLESITKRCLTISIKPGSKIDHYPVSAPSTQEAKCIVYCQNCSKSFSNMFKYLEHLTNKEHIRMMQELFADWTGHFYNRGRFYVNLFTYINESLKTNMPPVGTSLVMTCLTSVSKDDPFYLCFACQDFFHQSDIRNHFESRKHLISTQETGDEEPDKRRHSRCWRKYEGSTEFSSTSDDPPCSTCALYQNPWVLPFAWDGDLDDRTLTWTSWKKEQNGGRIFLKIFDIPHSVFQGLLTDSSYEQVFHSLQVQCHDFIKVPQRKTYSKHERNEEFPLLGQEFLALHNVAVAPNEEEVGCLCLLCERRVFKEEIEAHVFSREHVSKFLDCFHPGSLTSCTVDAETLLDLAKQAAKLHSLSRMQKISLDKPMWDSCSYQEAKMILANVKWITDHENLVPPINPKRKLVSRIPPKPTNKWQKTDDQKTCRTPSSSDTRPAATLKPKHPLKSKDPAAPKTKETSSATSEMAKPQVTNINTKSSVETLTEGSPDSERAAQKRKPPTSLHWKPEEIKMVRKGLPPVASSKTTPGGKLPKVGLNYLVVVSCERKQQVYCLLCSARLNASSHVTNSVHQYNYVKIKYPEWSGNEKMENELKRIVQKSADLDKLLPHTQIVQRLEVTKEEYQRLGHLPDHLAIERVKTLVEPRDPQASSSPSIDNAVHPSKDISSPCDVSSSGIPVFHDELSDFADGHQLWANLDQESEMDCVDEDDATLSEGQSFTEKSSDEEDVQVDEEIQDEAETMQTQDPQQVLDQCVQAEDTAETVLKTAERHSAAELQRHQSSSGKDLEAQNLIQEHQESLSDNKFNPNPILHDKEVAETPQQNQCQVQNDSLPHHEVSPVRVCRSGLEVVAGQQNQSVLSHKAKPAPMLHLRSEEHSSSQANPITLTGKKVLQSSHFQIFLKASNLDPNKVAGRAYVWECHSSYQKTFLCETCKGMLSSREICQHMVSLEHQLNYLRREDQRFLDMFWLQDDLPLDFKNQVLMKVIQALSKREKALNVEPECIWLTPELHKVLLEAPFSEALELLKSIRDEDFSVFHPSASAGRQTSERHKNGQQTAETQSMQESLPANSMSAQMLKKDQGREMADQNPDKAQSKEPTLPESFDAVGSGRTSRMNIFSSSSKTDHVVLPDPNVGAQNQRPQEVNPPISKVDPVVPSSSTFVDLSLQPCSSSLQPYYKSSVSQIEGTPHPQELNAPYSKHNLLVPSGPPNPNLNTCTGDPLQPGFNPGVSPLRRISVPLEVNSKSVTDLIPSSSVNLEQMINNVPSMRDINSTHRYSWQFVSKLISVYKTGHQPALNAAESRESMKMSHSLVVPQDNAMVPTADLGEPHKFCVPKDISNIGKPKPNETGINQLPINAIITSRSSHIKQTFKGQTRSDVSRQRQPPTPSHTQTVSSPGGINHYIQPAYLPSVHAGSAPTHSQLPLDAFRIYQQQHVYPSQSYRQQVVNPMNMHLTEQMPVVWSNADMQLHHSRRPESEK